MSPARFLPNVALFNRDLSWLSFNDRVLNEAADSSVPILERLRFAGIVSSNLDEFFMIRVAEVARLARRSPNRRFPDGLSAPQLLTLIREHVLRQKGRQAVVLRDIFDALSRHGIHIYTRLETHHALAFEIQRRLPPITTIRRKTKDPLPTLQSERIHVFIRFPGEYAILTIQDRNSRLIALPSLGRSLRFAFAEYWLCTEAAQIFRGSEIIEAFPFKIIREADLRYRPDEEESLPEQIVQAVGRRSRAKVVRLEVDAPAYTEGALFLATALGLDSAALYRYDLPLDLRVLGRIYDMEGYRKLRYPPIEPLVPKPLRQRERIFETVRKHDILLHHPYDSFETVENFIWRAAKDPHVTRINHTMYRTSADSSVMAALKSAAKNGKKVTAYVELKARFDELNNVRWANELRGAGARVMRPFGRLKVHSKMTQIFRKEGDLEVPYLHMATGNYHSTTALQYTDLGLLTADPQLGREITSYFTYIARRKRVPAFKNLLAAPRNLHSGILKLIHEETHIQRVGGRGHIIGKMNALVDPDIIQALYRASRAGVKVDLLVRGICCLRPGVRGLSENIRVISIIDRFLEHSRIYYFRAGGAEKIYLSSADWMPRNFYTRLEVALPIQDESLKRCIRDVILSNCLADNVKSWVLQPDGSYHRPPKPRPDQECRSQFILTALAKNTWRDTSLEHRLNIPRRLQGVLA